MSSKVKVVPAKPAVYLVSTYVDKDGGIHYARYQRKELTNHIIADMPLAKGDVETYRLFPQYFLTAGDEDSGPEAA